MTKLIGAAGAALIALAAGVALAETPKTGDATRPAETSAAAPTGYLDPTQRPDVAALIAPPPEPGDAGWVEDGVTFKKTRALAGAKRWEQALVDDSYKPDDMLKGFACAVGADLSATKTPKTARLVGRAVLDAVDASGAAKQVYKRQRPFVPTDEPICIERTDGLKASFSYPSGHATGGWMYGLLLAELAPDRTAAIMSRGRAYGESRVVCGVHWKTDVEAGRDAATAAFVVLQSNPAFRADLEAARAEIAAARRAGAPAADCAAQATLDRTPLN
jgi:acid phosphatase (class A)